MRQPFLVYNPVLVVDFVPITNSVNVGRCRRAGIDEFAQLIPLMGVSIRIRTPITKSKMAKIVSRLWLLLLREEAEPHHKGATSLYSRGSREEDFQPPHNRIDAQRTKYPSVCGLR